MDRASATPAIQLSVQNLFNVSKEEFSVIPGLEKDVTNLMTNLAFIGGFLDDVDKKFINDKPVKHWLHDMEAVASDADNVLDEMNYDLLSKKMKAIKSEKRVVLPSFFPFLGRNSRLRRMALRIREINMKIEATNKLARDLGLESKLENALAVPVAGPETDSLTFDTIFIGRDNDVSIIVDKLTTLPIDQALPIIPIVGMGGMGKTTLTRNVFNHKKIQTHFGKHIWVHVSNNFDPVSLLKKILSKMVPSVNHEVRSKEGVLKQLQGALEGKTYLLVLDDVWNQDRQKWEDFINSWRGITSVKGNGIIVTTRNTEVASIVHTLPIYEIEGLSEDNCWSIIKGKAFGTGDVPSAFETIGRNLAKKCHGLPLAANIVGGVLRGKSEDDWCSIEYMWPSDDENNISKILKSSFDNLSPPSLKKCFAYCSIFPKGSDIDKEELIELWMAEGFLQTDQINELEIVGGKFVELLHQNSLLQVTRRDFCGKIKHLTMHDLVHDLALCVSEVNYQVPYIDRKNDGDESSYMPNQQAKCLRTLVFQGEISTIMFSDFKSLRVLILIDLVKLPSSIGELIHLRYLDISRTMIEYLPDSIGELYHLQTLRADTPFLKKLPNTLIYLIYLRHLHLHNSTRLLPLNIGCLTSLQTLKRYGVANKEGGRISELGSLKNLKGSLNIFNLEMVNDNEEAETAYLFQKPNIVKLILRWNEFRDNRERETNDEEVLEGLQPHPNLKSLEIFGFNGITFPLWTMRMIGRDERRQWVGLDNLTKLSLKSCRECKEIPMLGHLPNLNYLKLSKLRNVEAIDYSFYGIDKCSSNNEVCKETVIVFPALTSLILEYMSSLLQWVDVKLPNAAENQPREVKVFPCLQYLKISGCNQLESVPSQFSCLKELDIRHCERLINFPDLQSFSFLEKLDIDGCPNLKSIPYSSVGQSQGLISLRELSIWDCEGLINLPDLHSFSSLEKLDIEGCPILKSIPYSDVEQSQGLISLRELSIENCKGLINLPDLRSLNSLERLVIKGCSNIKSIPYSSVGQSQGLTALCKLSISDCGGLINLPYEMVESCLPSLEELWLENLSSIMNMSMIINSLHQMPCLEALEIVNVPIIIPSSPTEIDTLPKLKRLSIGPPLSSRDCVYFKKVVDVILQLGRRQSICSLCLSGMEDWDSLPDELQHLTALSDLELKNLGIEELPEWFGNLTSLEELVLSDCKMLRRLPSVEAMRRLTKLTELDIKDCPALKERCVEQRSDDHDSEWPKISHIPRIWVDDFLYEYSMGEGGSNSDGRES